MTGKADRDIEKSYALGEFVAKLRRLADALEAGKPFEITIAGERIRVPADAIAGIEHERGDGEEEIEFQLKWTRRSRHSPRSHVGSRQRRREEMPPT